MKNLAALTLVTLWGSTDDSSDCFFDVTDVLIAFSNMLVPDSFSKRSLIELPKERVKIGWIGA